LALENAGIVTLLKSITDTTFFFKLKFIAVAKFPPDAGLRIAILQMLLLSDTTEPLSVNDTRTFQRVSTEGATKVLDDATQYPLLS